MTRSPDDGPRFGASLSTLEDTGRAIEEATCALAEALQGRGPDLVVLFVTHHHAGEFENLGGRIQQASGARHLVGCTGESVIGGSREVEQGPALALWGVAAEGLDVLPFSSRARPSGEDTVTIEGLPPQVDGGEGTLLLLGEPFSFPMAEYLKALDERRGGLPAVGGMASGGQGPGQNVLFRDREHFTEGALGVLLRGPLELRPVVSQGCRPVGRPWVVTSAEGVLVKKLGGQSAVKVLMNTLEELPEGDRGLFQNQPFLGRAVDPTRSSFGRGDFLVRALRGIAPQEGALAVADEGIRPGATVQFLVRDAASAGEDLEQLLAEAAAEAPSAAAGALVFSCNGRGSRMFTEPNHDARRVQEACGGSIPAAGFFAMGEIGPIGGRNFLHGFTASIGLFRERTV